MAKAPEINTPRIEEKEFDEKTVFDKVNHPAHYTQGRIECISAIKESLTPEEFRGYCKGNALKYIWREKHKNGKEDLKKAAWYLARLTEEA